MLFWLLLFVIVAGFATSVVYAGVTVYRKRHGYPADPYQKRIQDPTPTVESAGTLSLVAGAVALFLLIPLSFVWSHYTADYKRVVAQQAVIDVQKDRVESLEVRLDRFDYPDKPTVSLDSDYPWAAIVESLTDAEDKLAEARSERAEAERAIAGWAVGPASGIVTFVGDPRE